MQINRQTAVTICMMLALSSSSVFARPMQHANTFSSPAHMQVTPDTQVMQQELQAMPETQLMRDMPVTKFPVKVMQAVPVMTVAANSADQHKDKYLVVSRQLKFDGIDTTVWQPLGVQGKAPLVVFSHGINSASKHSRFLMMAIARAGYVVAAPAHADAMGHSKYLNIPDNNFFKPEKWSDKTYIDRSQDIQKLLKALKADPYWSAQIDWTKVALAGHSLGGYTALGVAGGWSKWKAPEIKAVIAMSPYLSPYLIKDRLSQIDIPVMYQGGTMDFGLTPKIKGDQGAFARTHGPCYFVEFKHAGHLSWTNFNNSQNRRDEISYYCIAFLDKYLKGSPAADLSRVMPGVHTLCSK